MDSMRSACVTKTIVALSAALLFLAGCADMNDNPAGGVTVTVNFRGGNDAQQLTGLTSPHTEIGNTAPILSVAVGAVVMTRAEPWSTSEAPTLTDAERDQLTDDAIQSADFITIEDLPYTAESISFLIPPDTAGNWQLVAVGAKANVDTLQDFDDNPNAASWYGFSDGAFLNGLVVPGTQIAVELKPGCTLSGAPDASGDGLGACP